MAFTFDCPSTLSGLGVRMHINEHGVYVTPQQRAEERAIDSDLPMDRETQLKT